MKVKKNNNNLDKYLKRVTDLKNYEVDIGWFADQGIHKSGYTYPQLAKIHRNGVQVPPRDILGVALFLNNPTNDRSLKRVLNKFLKESNSQTAKEVFELIGKREKRVIRQTFGDPRLGVTSNPTPLVDTGEWKNATTYRVKRKT